MIDRIVRAHGALAVGVLAVGMCVIWVHSGSLIFINNAHRASGFIGIAAEWLPKRRTAAPD